MNGKKKFSYLYDGDLCMVAYQGNVVLNVFRDLDGNWYDARYPRGYQSSPELLVSWLVRYKLLKV